MGIGTEAATQRQFCPDCGSMDIEHTNSVTLTGSGEIQTPMICHFCGWEGPASATVGMLTTEKLWDIESIGRVLLRVCAKHAAGPMTQVFRFVGLLEPGDQEGQDKILRAAFEGMITKAFEAAADHAQEKAREDLKQNGNRETRRRLEAEDRKKS